MDATSQTLSARKRSLKKAIAVIDEILSANNEAEENGDRRAFQNQMQDGALENLFRLALFLRRTFTNKSVACTDKTRTNIRDGFKVLLGFMVVTKAVKDGTDKTLVKCFNDVYGLKGEKALPQISKQVNPFSKMTVMSKNEEMKHRNTHVDMVMREWNKVMFPRYNKIVIGDEGVFSDIKNIEGSIGATIVGYLHLDENWSIFKKSHQATIMNKIHKVTAFCLAYNSIEALKRQKSALEDYKEGIEDISSKTEEEEDDDVRQVKLDELHEEVFGRMDDFMKKFNMPAKTLKQTMMNLNKNKKLKESARKTTHDVVNFMFDGGEKLLTGNKKEREEANRRFQKIIKKSALAAAKKNKNKKKSNK